MASNGPEVISPASTPPSSPRKHRQVPNINAIALNVPKADVNAQVKQIIPAPIQNHNNSSSSGSSTPRNSISIKSSTSPSLNSTPQPSIVNNAKRRGSHTPTAITTPVTSSSLGSSYDPYNYSIEMKVDARRSSLEGSGRIPVGNPSNITTTTTTINHSNNNYNYPSNPSSSANSTSTNAIVSGSINKSDSPTPLTAMKRKTKMDKENEERGEDPVLDPRELNGFIRYFMNNNNNNNSGGGSNSSQTNSVVTSQTTTASQLHSSRQSIISPTSQDLNNWRAMTMSSSGGYRGIGSSGGGGGASNDFFVKVARSELISPLRSVLRKELKNTFMMSTAASATSSSSSTPSSTPTALLNTITSNKLLYGSSGNFGSLDNNYPTSGRSSSSPSPRFMNNTSSRKSKIHEGKDAVMTPNNYLGKQRSGGVWRLSW
jgi:hypothetical protein